MKSFVLLIKNRFFQLISFVIFIIALIYLITFLDSHIDYIINSDDSSDLILGYLLSKNNKLLTDEWYYSTELRVLNCQIIYALVFKFTNNWHLARIISTIILYAILIGSYLFFCTAFRIREFFLITASIFIIPFSFDWFSFILKVPYYIPHISITLLILGLCELYSRKKTPTGFSFTLIIIAASVSFLAGLGGPRQLMILYIPLLITACFALLCNKSFFLNEAKYEYPILQNRLFIFSTTCFFSSIIGFLGNKLLSKYISFHKWSELSFMEFNLKKIESIIDGILSCYGYSASKFSTISISTNIICFLFVSISLLTIYKILKTKKNEQNWFGIFCVSNFIILASLVIFTNLPFENRYFLTLIFLSIPLLAYFCKNYFNSKACRLLIIFFVICLFFNSLTLYRQHSSVQSEYSDIVKILELNNFKEGFSTFWRGNLLTELSHGNINVRTWAPGPGDRIDNLSDINQLFPWLQKKSNFTTLPKGKVFVVLTTKEDKTKPWQKFSTEGKILYQSPNLIVYGFDSYENLLSSTTN